MELGDFIFDVLHLSLEGLDFHDILYGLLARRIVVLFHQSEIEDVKLVERIFDVSNSSCCGVEENLEDSVAEEIKGTESEPFENFVAKAWNFLVRREIHFQFC